jgi:hypothetical protein
MITNELAASLVEIAYTYRNAGRAIPSHLEADLHDVARADGISPRLRSDARRLLRLALNEVA